MSTIDASELFSTIENRRGRVVLIRHAESLKNVEGIHGGPGKPLTEGGEVSALELAGSLNLQDFYGARVIGGGAIQVSETAAIISKEVGGAIAVDRELRGIHLGSLSSRRLHGDANVTDDVRRSVDAWAMGSTSIDHLRIPGMEAPAAFAKRTLSALHRNLIYDSSPVIWVATRSSVILMKNLIANGPIFDTKLYISYDTTNLQVIDLTEWSRT